jgi:hypothetical protein
MRATDRRETHQSERARILTSVTVNPLEHFQAWWNQRGPSETGLIYDSWVSGWV